MAACVRKGVLQRFRYSQTWHAEPLAPACLDFEPDRSLARQGHMVARVHVLSGVAVHALLHVLAMHGCTCSTWVLSIPTHSRLDSLVL
jgi:hypothetical protein